MKYIYVRIAAYIGNTMKFDDLIADIRFQLKTYYAPGDELIFNALVENISSIDQNHLDSVFDSVGNYAQQLNIPYYFLVHN